jgi:hypothetical protein
MPKAANKEPKVVFPNTTGIYEPKVTKKDIPIEKIKEAVKEVKKKEVPTTAPPDPIMTIKKRDKVVVGGFSPTTKHLYPYPDAKADGYDIWGCNELGMQSPRMDVLFEVHDMTFPEFVNSFRNKAYIDWMKASTVPILMVKHYDDIPMSIPYPINQMLQRFGGFFNNTISYMLALAIHLKYKEIQLIGVDMSHPTEWDQRASVCMLLGRIMAMQELQGWPKLVVPPESLILKCPYLYGYQNASPMKVALEQTKEYYQGQANQYAMQLGQIKSAYDAAVGMVGGTDAFIRQHFTIPGKR